MSESEGTNPAESAPVPAVLSNAPDATLIPAPSRRRTVSRPAAPASPNANALNATIILRALRRRWLLASTLAITGASAAVLGAWLLLPPIPTVFATLQIEATPPKVIFNVADNSNLSRDDFSNYQRTQAALVKSRLVLTAALRNSKVAELSVIREKQDPLEWLDKDLKVDFPASPELLRISIDGEKADELVILVNEVRDAYLREIVNSERDARKKKLEHLKSILEDYELRLRADRKTLRDLVENFGSGDSQSQALTLQFSLEQLQMAKKDLLQCRSELKRLQIEVSTGNAVKDADVAPSVPFEAIEPQTLQDPIIVQQRLRIHDLEGRIARAKVTSAPYQTARHELEVAKKALEDREKELAGSVSKQLEVKSRQDKRSNLARQQRRLAELKSLEKELEDDVKRLTDECRTINKSTLDIVTLRESVSQLEGIYNKVKTETESLKVEVEAAPRVTKREDASISRAKAESKRNMAMGIGGAAAFALGLFGVCLLELRAGRISSTDEVVHGLGMNLVGSVPYLVSGNSPRRGELISVPAPYDQRVFAESIDATRTYLLHAAKQNCLQVVMISSALGGEGKTFLASQLAVSLAHAGRKTVLLDGDMRKPSIHEVFDLPNGPGLSDLLRRSLTIGSVLQPTATERLSLITAGEADGEALQALARGGAKPIFAQLRNQFDLIVVDSPPILPVTDGLLLGQEADGVVFSIFREVSRMPAVQAAWNRLDSLGIRMLGAVVNGIDENHYGYAYNGRY
jgi:capsular exopolysaccharide synthesis family protein